MTWLELRRGEYLLSTDPARVDVSAVVGYLSRSYWAPEMYLEMVRAGMYLAQKG